MEEVRSLRISVTRNIENQEYPFLQYVEVTNSIDTVHETVGCDLLGWTTDDGVKQSMRRGTEI